MYTAYLDYKNRALHGHPITTVSAGPFNDYVSAQEAIEKWVSVVKPMDNEYDTCIVEHN